jgi:hypothetical protein
MTKTVVARKRSTVNSMQLGIHSDSQEKYVVFSNVLRLPALLGSCPVAAEAGFARANADWV